VRAYAAEGAHVAIADVEKIKADELAAKIGGKTIAIELDVRDAKTIEALVARTVAKLGRVDILVNNAGIFNMAPLSEITEQDFDRQFAVNVRGLLFVSKTVAAQMIRQGRGGKIINISSQAGRRGEARVAVYCATKAAVISLTQSLGLELIQFGINVNAIASTRRCGTGSIRSSPNMKTGPSAKRSALLERRCRPDVWADLTIMAVPLYFWPPASRTMSSRRRSMSMGETG
jgi:NAD(P)-dependent dehydrogenase (short-subunit alcohol dehydrogenase family)